MGCMSRVPFSGGRGFGKRWSHSDATLSLPGGSFRRDALAPVYRRHPGAAARPGVGRAPPYAPRAANIYPNNIVRTMETEREDGAEEAINRVLAAEREAAEAVRRCEQQAVARLAARLTGEAP